jgi:uncharacterized protein (TIGR00730 family)
VPDRPCLAVYCASRLGDDPRYAEAAERTGTEVARQGADLVFGGAGVGLMGVVADAVLAADGHVTGVITAQLSDRELAHDRLDELVVVADMAARKAEMFRRADAFLALPGGLGTLEELAEVLCWAYLGLHSRPVGLLDVDGYWQHLLAFVDRAVSEGLAPERAAEVLEVGDDPEELVGRLLRRAARAEPPEPAADTPADRADRAGMGELT